MRAVAVNEQGLLRSLHTPISGGRVDDKFRDCRRGTLTFICFSTITSRALCHTSSTTTVAMTAHPPDQFDVVGNCKLIHLSQLTRLQIYEGCRIKIAQCVSSLFDLDPQGGSWLDDAVVGLCASMQDTLSRLRTTTGTLDSILERSSVHEDIYDLDLGYAYAHELDTEVNDTGSRHHGRASSPRMDTPCHERSSTECVPRHCSVPVPDECRTERCLQISTIEIRATHGIGESNGQGVVHRANSSLKSAVTSTRDQVTKVSPARRRVLSRSAPVKMPLLFAIDGGSIDAVAGQGVFRDFCDAVKFMRRQQILKLPAKHESVEQYLAFFDNVTYAEFACHLLYRVGSWRFLKRYHQLTQQRHEESSNTSRKRKRPDQAGKATSRARLSLIAQSTSRLPVSSGDSSRIEKQGATKLGNRIEASKVWHELCEIAGPALVGMVPPWPRTR